MKFREILDTINESILKIVSTKDVEKKDNLIVNTTAGINVIITDYPLTKEQKKILTSIKSILSKEYSKGQEELSMDDLEKGLDDILSNEEIEDGLEELLKEEKKPKSKERWLVSQTLLKYTTDNLATIIVAKSTIEQHAITPDCIL